MYVQYSFIFIHATDTSLNRIYHDHIKRLQNNYD